MIAEPPVDTADMALLWILYSSGFDSLGFGKMSIGLLLLPLNG